MRISHNPPHQLTGRIVIHAKSMCYPATWSGFWFRLKAGTDRGGPLFLIFTVLSLSVGARRPTCLTLSLPKEPLELSQGHSMYSQGGSNHSLKQLWLPRLLDKAELPSWEHCSLASQQRR